MSLPHRISVLSPKCEYASDRNVKQTVNVFVRDTKTDSEVVERAVEIEADPEATEIVCPQYQPPVYPKIDATIVENVEFLKKVIQAYQSNVLLINKLILCKKEMLRQMIALLLCKETSDIEIELELIEPGCCGTSSSKFRKIVYIHILEGSLRKNFKYDYSAAWNLFEQYAISLKYVQT